MTRPKRVFACTLLGVTLVLGTLPARADLFDSSPPPATVSNEAISQIQTAIDDEQYVDAGKLLNEAMLAGGDDPRLALLAGQLALARGRNQDALSFFKTIDTKPEVMPQALQGEGIALSLLGKSDDAMNALQSAVAKDPSLWRAWNALGTEYDRRHQWQKSEDAYNRAIGPSNSAAIVLNNRGFSRLCQKKWPEAVTDFVAALQKKPDLMAARNNLRLAMAMEGQYQRAVEGADTADRAAVLNNVGFAALLRGDYAEAKDLFSQAIKLRGKYYMLASANLELAQQLESKKSGASADLHADSH